VIKQETVWFVAGTDDYTLECLWSPFGLMGPPIAAVFDIGGTEEWEKGTVINFAMMDEGKRSSDFGEVCSWKDVTNFAGSADRKEPIFRRE
jgi:hypothetical protein